MIAQGNKRDLFFLFVFIFLGFLLEVAMYQEKPAAWLRIFWGQPFLGLIQISCVVAFCFLIYQWLAHKTVSVIFLKWIYGLIFLPLLLLPIFRCYFKMPYVFCRACPHPCPWGLSRTFVFNSFILLNLSGKFWCTCLCPFGTFQECQTQISKRNFRLFPWLMAAPYIVLFLFAGMYFLTLFRSPWMEWFREPYSWDMVTVLIALGILGAAFFIPKFWCRYFCPVGTVAELTSSFQQPHKTKTFS